MNNILISTVFGLGVGCFVTWYLDLLVGAVFGVLACLVLAAMVWLS